MKDEKKAWKKKQSVLLSRRREWRRLLAVDKNKIKKSK
jgi:hypothetical protein